MRGPEVPEPGADGLGGHERLELTRPDVDYRRDPGSKLLNADQSERARASVQRELSFHRTPDFQRQPGIIRLHDAYEGENVTFLVFDLCIRGDLRASLSSVGSLIGWEVM